MNKKPRIVVIGSLIFDFVARADRLSRVDTTAAGDAFNGALAVALAEGKDMEEAVVFANAAGSLAASKYGAQSSLCNRMELEELLKTGLDAQVI